LKKTYQKIEFIFRGNVVKDAIHLCKRLEGKVKYLSRTDQLRLPKDYFDADLFFFPTLHDGFAAVLTQAAAAGLPILATHNCGARDILSEGMDGWMVPIRKPEQLAERLAWCDENRDSFARIADEAGRPKKIVDWKIHACRLVEAGSYILSRIQTA